MYEVILTNFGTAVYHGANWDEAIAAARRAGFECAIYSAPKRLDATFSPIGGLRDYRPCSRLSA